MVKINWKSPWTWAAGAVVVLALGWLVIPHGNTVPPTPPIPIVEAKADIQTIATDTTRTVIEEHAHQKVNTTVTVPAGTVVGPGGITIEQNVENTDTTKVVEQKHEATHNDVQDVVIVTPPQPGAPVATTASKSRFGIGVGALVLPEVAPTVIGILRVWGPAGIGIGLSLPFHAYAAVTADVGKLFMFHITLGAGYSLDKKFVALAALTL